MSDEETTTMKIGLDLRWDMQRQQHPGPPPLLPPKHQLLFRLTRLAAMLKHYFSFSFYSFFFHWCDVT